MEQTNSRDEARGERFREVCRLLFPGLARAAIGARLGGVSGSSIRNWERGTSIPEDALERLKDLGMSPEYLIGGVGSPLLNGNGNERHRQPENDELFIGANETKAQARIIGANLKHLRKQKFPGWGGQKRFADFLSINPNDLCVYEYGRSAPNEARLEELARRLDLSPDDLRHPLPGVKVPSLETLNSPTAATESVWRDRVEELKQQVVRIEGKLEAVQEQNEKLEQQLGKLRDANYVLRSLLYGDDTEESRERKKRVMEKLDASISVLMRHPEEF